MADNSQRCHWDSGQDSRYYKAGNTLLQRTLSSFYRLWGWFNIRSDSMVRGQWLWAQGPGTGAVGPCRWGILLISLVQRALTQLLWGLSWDKDSPMMSTGKAPQNTGDEWVWKGSVEVTLCNHLLWQGFLKAVTMNRAFLSVCKEGNSTDSLGNLCLCSVTHLVFRDSCLYFSSYPLPLLLSLGNTGWPFPQLFLLCG